MTNAMKEKWNNRYKQSEQATVAARVLTDNLHLLPSEGKALDMACGLGANALLLSNQGLETHAWDISDEALKKLKDISTKCSLELTTLQRDVEAKPPEKNSFDIVVVSQFLNRPICLNLIDALRPEGLLFYQTFCLEKTENIGPRKTEFLLKPGELLQLFSTLEIIAYREERDCGNITQGFRNQAYLVARKPARD